MVVERGLEGRLASWTLRAECGPSLRYAQMSAKLDLATYGLCQANDTQTTKGQPTDRPLALYF